MFTEHYAHWIDGRALPTDGSARIARLSPAHDVLVATYAAGTVADTENAIAAARQAFDHGPWPSLPGGDRAAVLQRTAALIRENADSLARIETLESGKPIRQARDEMAWAAGIWDYAAALARTLHGDSTNMIGSSQLGFTLKEPVGVVALITPWNFPLLIVSQKLPFALAAGCTCVVKPSEFTSGTTLCLARLLQQAGLPDGVCNVVTGYGEPVGRVLAEHREVDKVSFTGSTAVGRKIVAASHGNLKRVTLELGGKNPQVIFPDADLDAAADAVVFGIYFNAGECCNSGSRVLLHRVIADSFLERVVELARTLPVGDPLDERTKMGAIVNEAQFDRILDCIASGTREGARLLLGGKRLGVGPGRFIEPTIFSDVTASMRIAREEIFGPVLSALRFDTTDEAIRLANSTAYGLSAAVWTRDVDRMMTCARGIRAGTIWGNTIMEGGCELPFGGYGQSGVGRELGPDALEPFTETKTVMLHLGPRKNLWHQPPGFAS